MASERFLYEQYKEHKEKGLRFLDTRNRKSAHYHLLKGAEYLLKLAKETEDPDLQEVRVENANKLQRLAGQIDLTAESNTETTGDGIPDLAEATERGEEEEPSDWLVTEKPGIDFSRVAGLEEVKEHIRLKMIYPFTHPEKAEVYRVRSGGGLLLYGPPGTGKTLIARAMAGELDATFFSITPSRILSKFVGEAEQNISDLFDEAREADRSVIFLDEIESLLPKRRDSRSSVMQRLVPQILAELDGFEGFDPNRGMMFVGATNEPWSLDYAAMRPGRFDEKAYIGLPDREARRNILDMNLEDVPVSDDLNLNELAKELNGYSGADIVHLCQRVCRRAFQEAVEEGTQSELHRADFDSVVQSLSPSVDRETLDKFESFREKHGPNE